MVEQACNSSTQEMEAGGSRVQDQSGLYSETLSQKSKEKKREEDREREGKEGRKEGSKERKKGRKLVGIGGTYL
jgi:hypothetical protein